MEEENQSQTAERLALALSDPHKLDEGGSYVIIPGGSRIHDLESLLDAPRRIRQRIGFSRLASFCAYVTEFGSDGFTRVFLQAKTGFARAVLDYHTPDGAAWCDHVATFEPALSEEWKRWNSRNGNNFDQRGFALFLEDNAPDIASPPSAEILDVARTLTAKQSVNFKKGIRLDNSTESLTYEETIDAKAGQKGELEIPTGFTLMIPVFEGRPARKLDARLRYKIQDGQLSFHYVLVRPHKVLNEEIDATAADIKKGTGIEPLFDV